MSPDQLRARALSDWRGLSEKPLTRDTARHVAEPLATLMASLGLGERLREQEVKSAWQGLVGDFIAGQSSPAALRAGVLIVQVLQPSMLYELDRVWKAQLLAKLKGRFGARTIRDIKFRIG